MKNLKNNWKFIINLVFTALSLVFSCLALVNSFEARDISYESNSISKKSNVIAQDANHIAKESARQSIEANKISFESNVISKNANEMTRKALADSLMKAEDANYLAKTSNEISEKSFVKSEEALNEAKKYAEVNSQIMWNSLRDAYDSADREVLEWEQANNLRRVAQPVKTPEALIELLDRLKISDEGRRLYIKRFDKRMSLIKASEVYEPYKERLSNLDFTLPTAPLLPSYLIDHRGRMIVDEKGNPIRTW